MRLSLVCLFKKTVPGHIFRGKFRLVKRVTRHAMDKQIAEYQRQDKIMHLLRHPYLIAEESSGHVKHLDKRGQTVERFKEEKRMATFKPHVTIEDRLNHLKTGEAWE